MPGNKKITDELAKYKEIKNILIRNARIAGPGREDDFISDILIEDGIIKYIKKNGDKPLNSPAHRHTTSEKGSGATGILTFTGGKAGAEIDAGGLVAIPAFFDMHVHIREPGNEDEENIESASAAAIHGGITSLCSMPNTDPPVDSEYLVRYIKSRASQVDFNILPVAAMTKKLEGNEITEVGLLKSAGAVALSDDGKCVQDAKLMYEIMKYSRQFEMLLILHEEDYTFSGSGFVHEGYYSAKLGLDGISSLSEEIIISRDLELAAKTGARIHITHLSSKKSVDLIRRAKENGVRVTCDVTPNHIFFNDSCLESYDTNFKVNPPIRSEEDRQTLIEGLRQGVIDVIASDHAPHLDEEKNTTFREAAHGAVGMETLFSASYTCLCNSGKFKLSRLLSFLSENPSRIIGAVPQGIVEGGRTDILLIDTGRQKIIDVNSFFSKGSNSPFAGIKLYGEIVCVIKNGKIAYI